MKNFIQLVKTKIKSEVFLSRDFQKSLHRFFWFDKDSLAIIAIWKSSKVDVIFCSARDQATTTELPKMPLLGLTWALDWFKLGSSWAQVNPYSSVGDFWSQIDNDNYDRMFKRFQFHGCWPVGFQNKNSSLEWISLWNPIEDISCLSDAEQERKNIESTSSLWLRC